MASRRCPFPSAFVALVCVLLLLPGVTERGQAQEPPTGRVVGRVLDVTSGRALAGVRISAVAIDRSTSTGESGRFSLELPAGTHRLRAERIGYQAVTRTVTVAAGETTTADFSLRELAVDLGEIVVTGTAGATERRSLANVVVTIDANERVEEAGIQSVSNIIRGHAPGVVLSEVSGQVGGGPQIRIRGLSTFGLDDGPLIYIDGVRVDNDQTRGVAAEGQGVGISSALNDIPPEDIESIEIIKGPAAATLYGTEASNGVIQIITKKGRVMDRPEIRLTTRQGGRYFRDPEGRIPPNWAIDPETGEPFSLNIVEQENRRGTPIFRSGRTQEYRAAVRGGLPALQYYTSGQWERQLGIEPDNEMNRFSARGNFSVTTSDRWDLSLSTALTQSDRQLSPSGSRGGVTFSTLFALPALKDTPARGFVLGPPEVLRSFQQFSFDTDRTTLSLTYNFEPTGWWQNRLTVGQDIVDDESEEIVERQTDPFVLQFIPADAARGSKLFEERDHRTTTFDYTGTFTASLTDRFTSNFSIGAQYVRKRTELASVNARGFPVPGITVTEGAATIDAAGDDFTENNTLGGFMQEQLVLNDRLYFTGAVRIDSNSAFGERSSVAAFPKASASWVFHEEPFFDVGWVDALRFRVAYGQSGIQPDAFAAVRTFVPVTSGSGQPAVTPGNVGNPDLSVERGKEFEGGFEAAFFGGRIGLDATYFNTKTEDAILQRDVSPSSGFTQSQFVNAGEIRNQGLEVQFSSLVVDRENFDFDINLNLATIKNEVLDLGGADQGLGFIPGPSVAGVPQTRVVPGFPVSSFFKRKVVSAELDADGRAINVLCDGGDPDGALLPDGTPLEQGGPAVPCAGAPQLFIDQGTPDFEGSLSGQITILKHLRLRALADWQTGERSFDATNFARCQVFRVCEANVRPEAFDPTLVAQFQSPFTLNDFTVAKSSFLNLREISASIDVPTRWLDFLAVPARSARVNVTGRNLFDPISDWPILSPENQFPALGGDNAGFQQNQVPLPAMWLVTVNLTL